MADSPIIFSGPMVRALLDGRKTMTRRLAFDKKGRPTIWSKILLAMRQQRELEERIKAIRPGDRLWVRENHAVWSAGYNDGSGRHISYQATEPDAPTSWTPSIHMFRFASRMTLVVTATKLERLQDISAADSVAEGVECDTCRAMGQSACQRRGCFASQAAFAELWKTLHGPYSWDTNPEVVAISFTVHKTNIDQMKEAA